MGDAVWVSTLIGDSPEAPARMVSDLWEADQEKVSEAERLAFSGQPIPPELHPMKMWFYRQYDGDDGDEKELSKGQQLDVSGRMPNVFMDSGYWVVSGKVADIFKQFDLGNCALHPVKLCQADRQTEILGEYYSWTISGYKAGLDAKLSGELPQFVFGKDGLWNMPFASQMNDDKIAVSQDIAEGNVKSEPVPSEWIAGEGAVAAPPNCDVWRDPFLFKSLFFNAALGEALIDAGLKKEFRLYRCKMV